VIGRYKGFLDGSEEQAKDAPGRAITPEPETPPAEEEDIIDPMPMSEVI